jgi:hypothetical protein
MRVVDESRSNAVAFKENVEAKVRVLIEEFADGRISREQFHVIYERYNAQLSIAHQALLTGNPEAVSIAQGGPPTVAIRDAYMGKATGLLIYHNKSGIILETLGDFQVPVSKISAALNDITSQMESNRLIDRRVEKVADKQWVMFAAGEFTTVVTQFLHQPSDIQSREIERLHHDFEEANRPLLCKEQVNSHRLAYPFLVFIKQKAARRA